MMKYSRKSHLKQAEIHVNEAQNKRRELEAPKMHTWQDKMSKTESQTGYMQSNKSHVMSGEKGKKEMQIRQNKIIGKMPIRQDRIIENQSQSGEMMIKNIQDKKENAKNESMLSEQYVHKKNIIQTQSQSGRSMVEMLGVLAIIAILSIGGIVGYKIAMNYYQANQIANEINIMHNDLKIKYALGNEELLLGNPYDETYNETYDKTPDDERYRGYLSTQYNRYPVNYDCTRKDMQDFYSCREADAYFIKVKNISKGVCKPLTTLLNAMNGLIYMEINKEVYEKYDLCTSDENNEFYIEFDAEDVNGNYDSNRPEGWCTKNENCPDEKPFCENERCVECTPETGCESNTQYCENNECIDCPGGKIWSGTACVDCMRDTDCLGTSDKPKCDNNICKSCAEIEPKKPLWYNNQCVECETDTDCLAKGTENPICNKDTNICEPCPNGQKWKESAQRCAAYECRTNADCINEKGDSDWYCYHKEMNTCSEEWGNDNTASGSCKKVSVAFEETTVTLSDGNTYYGSKENMNWWSACRLCAAWKGESESICVSDSSGMIATPAFMLDVSALSCNPSINPTKKQLGICYKNNSTELSNSIIKLREIWKRCCDTTGCNSCDYFPWLSNRYDGCYVYNLSLRNGSIHKDSYGGYHNGVFGDYAVCH